jgi:hypothetical protein
MQRNKISVKYVRHQNEVDDGQIFITNYEMLDELIRLAWRGRADESSILKSLDGKTRRKPIDMFRTRNTACLHGPRLRR